MKILVIGKGGREHALVWKLAQSSRVSKIYVAPGNPGMEPLAELLAYRVDTSVSQLIKLQKEIKRLGDWALTQGIDLTIVGPDDALAGGIVDYFKSLGLTIFGPSKSAARLESSKAFAKELMCRIGVPTAAHQTFDNIDDAIKYIRRQNYPLVVKANGLAAGKGAVICRDEIAAIQTASDMLSGAALGDAGNEIVIEEFMHGEEVSLFALCDGKNFITLPPAQDHKAIYEGDRGPNTGGMGAYAPAPAMTDELIKTAEKQIIHPVLGEMQRLGCPFEGVLYCGLMLTECGPKVVEFNVRFGDPECQVILPLLKNDLVEILEACCNGRIDQISLEIEPSASVCVVMASKGYPETYETGMVISGLKESNIRNNNIAVFHAGTERNNKDIVTAGGRVIGVTATAANIKMAVNNVYMSVNEITFKNSYYRRDIAHRAIDRLQ